MGTDVFESYEEKDVMGQTPANMVDALFAISRSLDGIAHAIHRLGNADAATPMGAIEAFGVVMKEGFSELAEAIRDADLKR